MNCVKKLIIILSTLSLSACSYFYGENGLVRDTSFDYVKAQQTKDLEIPENLNQKAKLDYAQIPTIGEKAKKSPIGKELNATSPIQVLAVLDNVRIDRQSENPAVIIQDKMDFLWRNLVDLIETNEIEPVIQDEDNHFIDTGWIAQDERGVWLGIEGRDEIDEFRAKYQIKMKPTNITSEVHLEVTRVNAQKWNDDTDAWEGVVSFWQDSAEMLNLILSNYDKNIAVRIKENRSKVIAGFKVELANDAQNNAALITDADKEMVWEKLPKVIEALNFNISDRDRRSMTYFFKYKKEEPGFFASLFSDDTEELPLEEGDYQVVLSDLGERTAITFKNGQGFPLEPAVMTKLYPSLSKLFGDQR